MARKRAAFTAFWTPSLGLIMFWIGSAFLALGVGLALSQRMFLQASLCAVAIVVLRMTLEAIVVLFQIHDVLVEIRDQGPDKDIQAKVVRARELAGKVRTNTPIGESRLETP